MARQFEISVQNRVGALADITETLAKAKVNIRAIATELKDAGLGVVKIITDDEHNTRKALAVNEFEFEEYDVIPLKLMDRPGEIAKLSRGLSNLGVDIESIFITDKENGITEIALKVSDLAKARKLLNLK